MKSLWKLSTIVIILSLLLSVAAFASPTSADGGRRNNAVSERLLVQFKPGTSWSDMARVHRHVGGRLGGIIPGIGVQVVAVPAGKGFSKSQAYRWHKEVKYVELDCLVEAIDIPNDPYFDKQWGMTKVQAPQAWSITQGSADIHIAILDTGVDMEHPDLAGKIVANINFSDSSTPDANGHSHGTHVAGIAAAATDNATGVAGMGYNSSLMNVKVLGDDGYGYWSWVAEGIIWAADNGAEVINLSLGGGGSSSTLEQAVDYAWSKGVVVVAAAGNNSTSSPFYPAYYANCVAVGATDSGDNLYSWSNYGDWVDVAAPGSAYSTMPDGQYGSKAGTSMASPHVAGLAGLVFSVATDTNGNGRLNDEVRSKIETTCDNVGIDVAYGRINAYRAVQGSSPPLTGQISGVVSDAGSAEPISGATVTDGTRSATTDSNGSYCLTDVPQGNYTVTASASGYQSSSKDVAVIAGETVIADFSLISVNHPPILDPIGDKSVGEGESLQFSISAFDIDDDSLTYLASNLPQGASFDPSTQTFSWTPNIGQAGSYPDVHFEVSDGSLSDSEDITITVNAVSLTGEIAGTVTDADSGGAINGATVTDGTRSATTDPNGSYTIYDVPEGTYTVTASAPGYQESSQSNVNVYAGETTTVGFSLAKEPVNNTMWVESITFTPAGRNLKIKVKIVNPQPVPEARVTLELERDGVPVSEFSGLTNSTGEATFMWKKTASGEYLATVTSLTQSQYTWDKSKGVISESYTVNGSRSSNPKGK